MTNRHSNMVSRLATESNRLAKAKIEEEGLDGEYMVESTADLRKLVIAATGVDILEKDQKHSEAPMKYSLIFLRYGKT